MNATDLQKAALEKMAKQKGAIQNMARRGLRTRQQHSSDRMMSHIVQIIIILVIGLPFALLAFLAFVFWAWGQVGGG